MASINNNGNDSNRGNINEHQTHLSDNSNRVIAPERSQRSRDFDNVLRRGGNWESHPRGEYVLLCREHLDRIEDIVEIGSTFLKIYRPIRHRINYRGREMQRISSLSNSIRVFATSLFCTTILTIRAPKITNVSTGNERLTTHFIHLFEGVASGSQVLIKCLQQR